MSSTVWRRTRNPPPTGSDGVCKLDGDECSSGFRPTFGVLDPLSLTDSSERPPRRFAVVDGRQAVHRSRSRCLKDTTWTVYLSCTRQSTTDTVTCCPRPRKPFPLEILERRYVGRQCGRR